MINHSDNKARQQKELWGWRLYDRQEGVGEGSQTKFEKGQVGNIGGGLHKEGG